MRIRYHKTCKGEPYFLFGINADICAWITACTQSSDKDYKEQFLAGSIFCKYPSFIVRCIKPDGTAESNTIDAGSLTKDDYISALGERDPYKRREVCIKIIRKLWASRPGLGPYPLLDELISFENNQVFYSKYRDHAAHQLMNYLLGLYIYYHCEPIHTAINEEILNSMPELEEEKVEDEFILRWFVASITHDIGYVLETPEADCTQNENGEKIKLWKLVEEGINDLLQNCLTRTPCFSGQDPRVDKKINEKLQRGQSWSPFCPPPSINHPKQIGLEDESTDCLDQLKSVLEASGIKIVAPLRSYYDLAHDNAPKGRGNMGYWDHGITSAVILIRVWSAYKQKIHAILKHAASESPTDPENKKLNLDHWKGNIQKLASYEINKDEYISKDLPDYRSICAAAEAIAAHNINKDIWENQGAAFDNAGFRISNFWLSFYSSDETHNPT